MNHKAYIQHVLRVGGACICERCEDYRRRVAEPAEPFRRDEPRSVALVRAAAAAVARKVFP
jgi:hypothetical protein